MHLTIVSPYPPIVTGVSEYGQRICHGLVETGRFSRITVLAEEVPGTLRRERCGDIAVERIWRGGVPEAGWRIAQRLRTLNPDLVWFNVSAGAFGRSSASAASGMFAVSSAWLSGIPTIVTLHEMIDRVDLAALGVPCAPLTRYAARAVMRLATQCDAICVTLREHATHLAASRPGLPCWHIPLPSSDAPELLAYPGEPVVLAFGLWAPYKGLDALIAACKELSQGSYPHLRLVIAGADHPRFRHYLRRAEVQHKDDRICWRGFVPDSALRGLYAHSTITVIANLATTGSSSTLLRSVAWGRPIVASDLPELRHAAQEMDLRVTFCPVGNAAAFASAIDRYLANPGLRDRHTRHNFASVARLSLAETCRTYLHVFESVLMMRSIEAHARKGAPDLGRFGRAATMNRWRDQIRDE